MGEGRGVYRVSVGRPEGKRPLGRPKSRWEDNIKLGLRELESMGRIGFSWLRIESSGGLCDYGNEPSSSIKIGGYFFIS
jgi:hypothetical protein